MAFETFYSAWAWVENYLDSPSDVNFYEAQPLNKLTAEVYQNQAEPKAELSDYKDALSNELDETWNSHAEWFYKEPDLVPLQPILDSREINVEGYRNKPSGSQLFVSEDHKRPENKVQHFSSNTKPFVDGKKSKEISAIHTSEESKTRRRSKSAKPTSRRPEEKKPLRCPKCCKIFQRKDYFDDHLKAHADEEHLYSATYVETFAKNDESTQQAIFSFDKNGYVCNVCGKRFKTKFVLIQHSQEHAEKQSFVCEFCRKQFKFKVNLKKHMIVHSNELHVCQHCKKAYKWRRNLISHQKARGHFGAHVEKLRSFNEVRENETYSLSNEKHLPRGISRDHAENSKSKRVSTDESYNQVTTKFLNNLKEVCTSFQDNYDNSFFLTPLEDSFAGITENNSWTSDYYPKNAVNEYLGTAKAETGAEIFSWSPDQNYERNERDYFEMPIFSSGDSCSWSYNQERAASDSFKVPVTSIENYLWPPDTYQNSASTIESCDWISDYNQKYTANECLNKYYPDNEVKENYQNSASTIENCDWTPDYNQKYTSNECLNKYYPDTTQSFVYIPDDQETENECSNALNATETDTWSTNYIQGGTIQEHCNTISENYVRAEDCSQKSIVVENSNTSSAIAAEGSLCIIQNCQEPLIQCNLSAKNISENKSCSRASNNRKELPINENLSTLNAIAEENYLSMPNRCEETIVKVCSNRTNLTATRSSWDIDSRGRCNPRAPNIMREKYGGRIRLASDCNQKQ